MSEHSLVVSGADEAWKHASAVFIRLVERRSFSYPGRHEALFQVKPSAGIREPGRTGRMWLCPQQPLHGLVYRDVPERRPARRTDRAGVPLRGWEPHHPQRPSGLCAINYGNMAGDDGDGKGDCHNATHREGHGSGPQRPVPAGPPSTGTPIGSLVVRDLRRLLRTTQFLSIRGRHPRTLRRSWARVLMSLLLTNARWFACQSGGSGYPSSD